MSEEVSSVASLLEQLAAQQALLDAYDPDSAALLVRLVKVCAERDEAYRLLSVALETIELLRGELAAAREWQRPIGKERGR